MCQGVTWFAKIESSSVGQEYHNSVLLLKPELDGPSERFTDVDCLGAETPEGPCPGEGRGREPGSVLDVRREYGQVDLELEHLEELERQHREAKHRVVPRHLHLPLLVLLLRVPVVLLPPVVPPDGRAH